MNLSHCLEPLTAAHRKRLDGLARTLPGKIFISRWKHETAAERDVRLANERRLVTRRIPKP